MRTHGARVRAGGLGALHLLLAIEAGVAFLMAVLIVAPIIRRLFRPDVKPPSEGIARA